MDGVKLIEKRSAERINDVEHKHAHETPVFKQQGVFYFLLFFSMAGDAGKREVQDACNDKENTHHPENLSVVCLHNKADERCTRGIAQRTAETELPKIPSSAFQHFERVVILKGDRRIKKDVKQQDTERQPQGCFGCVKSKADNCADQQKHADNLVFAFGFIAQYSP